MTLNNTGLSSIIINNDCSISWNSAILKYCDQWRQYLGNYDFYIVFCWIYIIAGVISNFWNVKYKKNIDVKILNRNLPLNIDFDLMRSIQNVSSLTIMIRIFELYYISVFHLGV